MDIIKEINAFRLENGVSLEVTESVAIEAEVCIYVNGRHYGVLVASPQNLEELVLGHLLSSGIICGISDIKQISWDAEFREAHVETTCGDVPFSPVPDGLFVQANDILLNADKFLHKSELFIKTGAVHSCALIIDVQLLHFMEDIGRHNAFDKTIGAAVTAKTPLGQAVMLTSGRIPADMMTKIIRCGIQIAVSRSAPTDSAVSLALSNNVTLCGFARGKRMNIYTGKQRIGIL